MTNPLQLTLGLLKPDVVANPVFLTRVLHRLAHEPGLMISRQRTLQWSAAQAEAFYSEHRGKFFYQRLCQYMTSGPFMALVLQGPDAIKEWRTLIGPTHPIR